MSTSNTDSLSVTEHEWVDIHGTQCIRLRFQEPTPSEKPRESARRRKYKDNLGKDHTNTFMLDTRTTSKGWDYNNIIIYVEDLERWISFFDALYEERGLIKVTSDITGGKQHTYQDSGDEAAVHINVYPGKRKIMIQPGSHGEGDLLNWIKDAVKGNLAKPDQQHITDGGTLLAGEQNPASPTNVPGHIRMGTTETSASLSTVSDELCLTTSCQKKGESNLPLPQPQPPLMDSIDSVSTASCTSPTSVGNKKEAVSQHTEDASSSSVPKCSTSATSVTIKPSLIQPSHVHIPTLNQTPVPNKGTESPPMAPTQMLVSSRGAKAPSRSHSASQTTWSSRDKSVMCNNVVVNEPLCFLQNKLNNVPLDIIVKLMVDFYKPEELKHAKSVLFTNVSTTDARGNERRNIGRTGDNKARNDTGDMATVLLELDLNQPHAIFVAENLANLPPLSLNNIDILKLLSEIEAMKSSIKALTDSQMDILHFQQERLPPAPVIQPQACQSQHEAPPQSPLLSGSNKELEEGETSSDSEYSEEAQTDQRQQETSSPASSVRDSNDELEEGEIVSESDVSINEPQSYPPLPRPQVLPKHEEEAHSCPLFTVPPPKLDFIKAIREPAIPRIKSRVYTRTSNANQNNSTKGQQKRHLKNADPSVPSQQKHLQVVFGSGHSNVLKAALKTTRQNNSNSNNRECIGVFLSRFAPKTTVKAIAQHISSETGLTVQPEKLITRYSSYSSFFIRANKQVRATLLYPDLWPTRTLLKPYFA